MIVFVLGPGRCGTSTAARLLHEQMGVSMGTRFRQADKQNPQGFYEDLDFKQPNEALISGAINLKEWQKRVSGVLAQRSEPWGLKDPRLCYLLGFYLDLMDQPPEFIRCRRSIHRVAASMSRCYGWSLAEALAETARREALLDAQTAGCREISFDAYRTDEEILQCLH